MRSGCGILIYSAGQGLSELDIFVDFLPNLCKGDNFCDFLFAFLHT